MSDGGRAVIDDSSTVEGLVSFLLGLLLAVAELTSIVLLSTKTLLHSTGFRSIPLHCVTSINIIHSS